MFGQFSLIWITAAHVTILRRLAFEANGRGAQCGFQAIQPDSTDGILKEAMGLLMAQKQHDDLTSSLVF